MELLKRRGKYRPEDFARLNLSEKVDVKELKQQWLLALAGAEAFIHQAPPEDVGCLYYDSNSQKFTKPDFTKSPQTPPSKHFGRHGGILPVVTSQTSP